MSLVDACNRYLQKHFVQVSESDEFLSLNFEEVLDIISRDELNVPAESNVSVCPAEFASFVIRVL